MPTLTAPYIETQQVVTGFMYQLHIAEEDQGQGITRLEFGPYHFQGVAPQVKYPEAVTNEMCPPGWSGIRWVTDESGASWLRWEGGRVDPEDGEMLFQMTSNYAPSNSGAGLMVWRGNARAPERFPIAAPDYSHPPPQINPRHDVTGNGIIFAKGGGCAPAFVLAFCAIIVLAVRHLLS